MKKIVLTSITGLNKKGWGEKIEETRAYNLHEVALFLSCLTAPERRECYDLLSTIPHLSIPFVHARSDMRGDEYAFDASLRNKEIQSSSNK